MRNYFYTVKFPGPTHGPDTPQAEKTEFKGLQEMAMSNTTFRTEGWEQELTGKW